MTTTISGLSLSLSYAEFSMTSARNVGSASSTSNVPPTGQAPATAAVPAQQGEHPHEHGRFMQAVTMSFIQIGIDISGQGGTSAATGSGAAAPAGTGTSGDAAGTGTTTDPASGNAANGDLTQMLQTFMHALFQAMSQLGHSEGQGEREGDGDHDDAKSSTSPQVAAYTGPAGKVDALLQSVKADTAAGTPPSDPAVNNVPATTNPPATPPATTATTNSSSDTTPPATQNAASTSPLSSLKDAFKQLVEASGASAGNNTTAQTLQSFLESLMQNLSSAQATTQSFKMTGIFVSFSA